MTSPANQNQSENSDRAFRLGTWRIDPAAREATDGTHRRKLSPKAMAVLQEIVSARGEVVRRSELLDRVWPDVHVGEESLTHAISELRRAFGDSRCASALIETVQKAGYRIRAQVSFDDPKCLAPTGPAAEVFDLDAYMLCLEARRHSERGGDDGVFKAEELSCEAVGRAPNFAFAYAEYAVSAMVRCLYRNSGGLTPTNAAAMAEKAVRLRPDLAYGQAAKGFALHALGHFDVARQAFSVALAQDPNDFETHYLCARALFAAGEMAAATTIASKAAALHTDDYRCLYLAARAAWASGDATRSKAALRLCLQRVERRLETDPDEPRARNLLGPLLALLDRPHEAIDAVARDEASGAPIEFYNVAALARAGEKRAALDRFELVVDKGWRHGAWMNAEPAIQGLRGEPRFERLAKALEAA